MFITTRYEFENGDVKILNVENSYDDALHLSFDKILADIDQYRQTTDQIIINSTTDIMIYRRGVWSGKYSLYHYIIHEFTSNEEEEED